MPEHLRLNISSVLLSILGAWIRQCARGRPRAVAIAESAASAMGPGWTTVEKKDPQKIGSLEGTWDIVGHDPKVKVLGSSWKNRDHESYR